MDERPRNPSDDVWLPHEPGRPADSRPDYPTLPQSALDPAGSGAAAYSSAGSHPAGFGSAEPPPPTNRGRRLLAGAALATGLAVGGAGVAAAVTSGYRALPGGGQSAESAGSQTGVFPGIGEPGADAPGQSQPGFEGFRGRGGHHGHGGRGGVGGLRGALHGELVVPQEDGTGTRTITVQSGTVTAVSSTRVSVRSTDGFTATYVVNSSTRVAGTSGISAVKKDHEVFVVATKSGSTLTAIRVGDRTLREQRRPDDDDRRAPQSPTPSPSASTSGARGASA